MNTSSIWRRWLVGLFALMLAATLVVWGFFPDLFTLLATGDDRELQAETTVDPVLPNEPSLLLLAIDGVDRDLLYEMLRAGELPMLASLVFGQGKQFPHAHFEERLLSTLPSSTLAAWATVFTGKVPAEHGVAGNEYFVREQRRFAAPAPVSIINPAPVVQTYTEGYANDLLAVPTLYEQLRERKPNLSSWVSMSQFYSGASRLLLADRTVVAGAFKALLSESMSGAAADSIYAELDEEVVDTLNETLQKESAPHVITVYLTGTDHVAHSAETGPDAVRREYLKEVLDPILGRLKGVLDQQGALRERYVVITSDHGHTGVVRQEKHALSTELDNDPPDVLTRSGFSVRPFELEVEAEHPFQSVLAYGGAMAYVYLADRSTCVDESAPCDWAKPPRFEEDVLVAAEAFFQANASGKYAKKMHGALDMILTRRPRFHEDEDLPFEVYMGGGRIEPLESYLARHPRPTYVKFDARLRDLAVGRYGERAGDILLLANNGNVDEPEQRYYFAGLYHSWHGSPSRKDSEVPFILAHPRRSSAELATWTRAALGKARQQDVTPLLLELLAPR